MAKKFRIHGDNIVECERIADLIVSEITEIKVMDKKLISPSTIVVHLEFEYDNSNYDWDIELLPGFNKNGRSRWERDIFDALRKAGSFLDETPDAIITDISGNKEEILCAIEFCSALQAGNQAWQRSGRAFSTGRAGCPYIYIVDFVKYELDPTTREKKNLRFPNAAVPYSYINFSKNSDQFVAQVYVRSESFNENDPALAGFNCGDFAENELKKYLIKRMASLDTTFEEKIILTKNLNVVKFLSKSYNKNKSFLSRDWDKIYAEDKNIIDYCIEENRFPFHKIMAQKSAHGKMLDVLKIIEKDSVGFTSKDLPIGIIKPAVKRRFIEELKGLYPSFDNAILNKIANSDRKLVVCLVKGFKPAGDDNRPDRGILPLAAMLSNNDTETLTIIYGPIIKKNYDMLNDRTNDLAKNNGFWRAILALSDYLMLDAPVLDESIGDVEKLYDTSELKSFYLNNSHSSENLTIDVFSSRPREYHEDDVDTGMHYMFHTLLAEVCYEGMCNPPGGDWSGVSIIDGMHEERWLSLPRVSESVKGKRPDHIIEIFDAYDKPILLTIESKEKSADLESGVGPGLINYVQSLLSFVPNAERTKEGNDWHEGDKKIKISNYEMISAAAYLKTYAQEDNVVRANSQCDMLFVMEPKQIGWIIEVIPYTDMANRLKHFLQLHLNNNKEIELK